MLLTMQQLQFFCRRPSRDLTLVRRQALRSASLLRIDADLDRVLFDRSYCFRFRTRSRGRPTHRWIRFARSSSAAISRSMPTRFRRSRVPRVGPSAHLPPPAQSPNAFAVRCALRGWSRSRSRCGSSFPARRVRSAARTFGSSRTFPRAACIANCTICAFLAIGYLAAAAASVRDFALQWAAAVRRASRSHGSSLRRRVLRRRATFRRSRSTRRRTRGPGCRRCSSPGDRGDGLDRCRGSAWNVVPLNTVQFSFPERRRWRKFTGDDGWLRAQRPTLINGPNCTRISTACMQFALPPKAFRRRARAVASALPRLDDRRAAAGRFPGCRGRSGAGDAHGVSAGRAGLGDAAVVKAQRPSYDGVFAADGWWTCALSQWHRALAQGIGGAITTNANALPVDPALKRSRTSKDAERCRR